MRKGWLAAVVVLTGIFIGGVWFAPLLVGAHMGAGGMMGPGTYPDWQRMYEECEEMMEHMMGYRGEYSHPMYPGPPEEKEQTKKALSQEEAVSIVQNYLTRTGNPNLKIGKVEKEDDGNYLVEIVTKDGSLVDKLEVNKFTGWFHSIYSE